jgi:hypothetical protein
MAKIPQVKSPEKELRFTRSGQAVAFWLMAAVMVSAGVTLLACAAYRARNPELPHPAWAVAPFVAAALLARQAVRMTRHAYLILTPLGIEIFPLFRPVHGMRLVTWQEIGAADVSGDMKLLTLHHDAGKTSGIRLSLAPVRKDRRSLLAKAVLSRVSPPRSDPPPHAPAFTPDSNC